MAARWRTCGGAAASSSAAAGPTRAAQPVTPPSLVTSRYLTKVSRPVIDLRHQQDVIYLY